MAAFVPKTWSASEPLTVSDFNAYIATPLNILRPYESTGQTVGATVLHPEIYQMPASSALMLYGHVMAAADGDFSAAFLCRFGATFRRVGSATPVLAGSYVDMYDDTAAVLTVSIQVAAPGQAYFVMTGAAAQVWNWKAIYSYVEL